VSVLNERLGAQLLSGAPAADALAVVERLLAVQAQDPRGFRLAVRARSENLLAADVDRALTEERTLVVTWLNRGTLHLVRREDLPWLYALTTPPLLAGNARRLAQEGVSEAAAERGVAVIERELAEHGPRTRPQLADALERAGVRTAGQALVHVLLLACLRGVAVRGPIVSGEHAYALVIDWLDAPLSPLSAERRERAVAELARRYLVGHGPCDERDLARWAGLPLRDARAGLRAIAGELAERADGLVALSGRADPPPLPPPRLLGSFEPLLCGWRSRAFVAGADEVVLVRNGLFRPFAIVEGRAVATWRLTRGRVTLEPIAPITPETSRALEGDGARVREFLAIA
jgi:hypothetical protein